MYYVNLDCANLRAFEPSRKLYYQLLRFPQEIIPVMDFTITQILMEMFQDVDLGDRGLVIRPFNLGKSVSMRELDPTGGFIRVLK